MVVQCNAFNRSRIGTVVCIPLTSNLKWADAPGNVLLPKSETGLPQDSVANVSLIVALDKQVLTDRIGQNPAPADWTSSLPGSTASSVDKSRAGRW